MKLPFSKIISPLLKPYLGNTRMFCQHPTFGISIFYTYFYGTLGFVSNYIILLMYQSSSVSPEKGPVTFPIIYLRRNYPQTFAVCIQAGIF